MNINNNNNNNDDDDDDGKLQIALEIYTSVLYTEKTRPTDLSCISLGDKFIS